VHHNYFLKTSSDMECAFDSMAQCEAAKRGNGDICQPSKCGQRLIWYGWHMLHSAIPSGNGGRNSSRHQT
jgi:hypothetical protein